MITQLRLMSLIRIGLNSSVIDAIVTGGNGFIGQALAARLRTAGNIVLSLDRTAGDIADAVTWHALPPARVLYHLAGNSYVPDSWTMGPEFVRTNVSGTERALEYCRRNGSRLVFASAYVYGLPARLPIVEDDPVRPNNPYAVSKRLAEQLCEFAAQYQNVTATVLRVFNVFGPSQRSEFLIPQLIHQVNLGQQIKVMDLTPQRDYIYLSDVVEAFANAGEIQKGFHTVNIGSGRSLSVREIVDVIQSVAGTRLPVISEGIERKHEIPIVVADISRAHQLLGWRPRISFEDGVGNLLKRKRYEHN